MPDRRRLWAQITGAITRTEVVVSGGPMDEIYEAVVHYSYTIGETSYTGRDSIACEFRSQAQELIRRHPPIGAAELVFYDPAQPTQAILEQTLVTAESVADIAGLFSPEMLAAFIRAAVIFAAFCALCFAAAVVLSALR